MLILLLIILSPMIGYKYYFRDAIQIDMDITINGQKISMDNAKATYVFEDGKSHALSSKDNHYSLSGGDYGQYVIKIVIPGKSIDNKADDLILKIEYINSNWWYKMKANCKLDLDYQEKQYNGNYSILVKYNDNTKYEENEKVNVKNQCIKLFWGI